MSAPVLDSGDTSGPRRGPGGAVQALVFIALFALAGTFAYFNLYSIFTDYDDEGYFLRAVQHFVDGHPLYEELPNPYGPVYYLSEWVIHVPLGVPITNDAVRLNSLFFWLLTSFFCALIVRATTRSTTLTAVTFLATFLHLRAYPREPGHPQELVGILLAAAMLLPTLPALETDRGRTILAAALGGITAALVLVKINVGFFLGISFFVAVAAALHPGRVRGFVRIAAAGIALALPWVLMFWSAPPPPDCKIAITRYALLATFTTVPILLFAWYPAPRPWEGLIRPRDVASAAVMFAAVLGVVVGIVLATGTTPGGIIGSLILLPRRLPAEFCYDVSVHWLSPIWAGASCAAAIACLAGWRRSARREPGADARPAKLVALMKIGFGCVAVVITANSFYGPLRLMMFATPLVWLVLIPPVHAGGRDQWPGHLVRLVMASVAAIEILQAYPVAGSQTAFASLAAVPAAFTCLADGLAWFRGAAAVDGRHSAARGRLWPGLAMTVVTAYMVGYTIYGLKGQYDRYAQGTPLGLAGAKRIRLPQARAAEYRELAATLESSADSFVATTGMNSLYLWTGIRPPERALISSELNISTADEQLDILRALMRHARPMVVENTLTMPGESKPMMREIKQAFRPWRQVGQYLLLVPKSAAAE